MNPNGYDNPLGSFGVTNRDYAGVVATAMAESSVNAPVEEMQGIADVIANRLENARAYGARAPGAYGVVSGQFGGWAQFDPWGGVAPGTKPQGSVHANKTLREGLKAALNPNYAETLPDALKEKMAKAQTATMSVFGSGVARGIAKGATTFSGSNVQLSANRTKEHNALGLGQATRLGGTSFYGKGYDPTAEFDLNQNIETQIAQDVPINPSLPDFRDMVFGDVPVDPVPIGRVASSSIPDLTPAREAGFSWDLAGATLPDDFGMDFSQYEDTPDFSGITAGTAFDSFPGFSPAAAATPDFSDIDLGSYPDITESLYSDPLADVSVQAADWDSMLETYGPAMSEMDTSFGGYSAGFGDGPYGVTPDFNAPSLEQRNAEAFNQDAINSLGSQIGSLEQSLAANERATFDYNDRVLSSPTLGSFDTTKAGIRDQEFDIGDYGIGATVGAAGFAPTSFDDVPAQAAPQLSTPSFDMQSMYADDMADKLGAPQLSTPSVSPQAPMATARASAPAPRASAPAPRASAPPQGDWGLPDTAPTPPSRPSSAIAAAPGAPAVGGPFSSITGPINNAISSVTGPINSAVSSFTDPIKDSLRDMGLGYSTSHTINGKPADFMDAMASPEIAQGFGSGIFDGWTGGALKGAALGGLTGGPFGAVMGGIFGAADPFGRITDRLGSAFTGWQNGQGFDLGYGPMASWDTWDPETYGFGPGFNSRGERSPTGRNESGNATVGDGSYAEGSGRNDNNPQGIL